MAVVLVGPEKKRFEIHKGLVCSRSEFFKAAFTGNFKESTDGILTLPEDDPAPFKHFVHWLYTGSLRGLYYPESVHPTLKELTDKVRAEVLSQKLLHAEELRRTNPHRELWEHANYRDLPFASLISMYILADKLQIPRLKDASITALIEVYGMSSTVSRAPEGKALWTADGMGLFTSMNMAWNTLPSESKLCQVLLHLFCDNTAGIELSGDDGNIGFNPTFAVAMGNLFAKRWLQKLPANDWTKPGAICYYHEHEGASCDLTEKYLEDRKAMGRSD